MGVTLTDVLLFGKAQLADVDKATLVIYRRNILRWSALGGYLDVIVKGVSPLSLPDAIADSLTYVKAFGGTEQRNLPDGYIERQFIYMMDGSYIKVEDLPISAGYKVEFDFQTLTLSSPLRNYIGGRVGGVSAGGGFRLSKLASSNNNRVVLYGFEAGTEYYDPTTQFQPNTRYKYTYNNGVCTLESGGTVVSTRTFTVTDDTSTNWVINGYINGTYLQSESDGIYVYSLKVWNDQGELVMNLVPAVQRGTVPVVGFYDTVTGGFRTQTAGTFAAGGEAVPTPDAPMDIVSNNGVLKARHQSGLPLGYTLLEYIESTGTQYINTGYFFTDVATETVTTDFMRTSASSTGSLIYGFRDSYKVNGYGIQVSNNGSTYMQYGAIDSGLGSTPTASMNTRYTITQTGPKYTFLGASYTSTGETPTQNYPLTVFAINNGGTPAASNMTMMRLYGMTIKDANNVVKMNLVPVKRSDNVLGVFDTVSGQFFTNAGTGTFTAGDPVSDPVEIYTDGTVETIKDSLNNTATAEMLLKVGDYQDVQSIIDGAVTRKVGVKVLDGTENWQNISNFFNLAKTDVGSDSTVLPSNSTDFVCSHFAIKTYQQLTSDCVNIGGSYINFKYDSTITVLADWKTWLANQYAAGTPVIVIYPLATATTESVTGQTLQVQAGDNTLEITQASLSGLKLEAQYQASVSLTIQEVQDANLDPNVEVTIN